MKGKPIPAALTAVFLAAEAVLYAVFLTLDILGRGEQTLWLKYAGILLCLAFAALCALRGGDKLVAPALLLTACADWFLLIRSERLMLGVALFIGVQAIYLLRLYKAGAGAAVPLRLMLILVMLAILFWMDVASPLTLLALFYFSQLLANTILAWGIPRMRRFALGLILFVGCDVCVGLFNSPDLFPGLTSLVSVGMWFFYLPSQVLIALSAMPEKELSP